MKWLCILLSMLMSCSAITRTTDVLIVKPLKCKTESLCKECKVKCPSGIHVTGDPREPYIIIHWKYKWR